MNRPMWFSPDRAYTLEQKRDVIEMLYDAWIQNPSMRFGQLLNNHLDDLQRLPLIEDYALADRVSRAESIPENATCQVCHEPATHQAIATRHRGEKREESRKDTVYACLMHYPMVISKVEKVLDAWKRGEDTWPPYE